MSLLLAVVFGKQPIMVLRFLPFLMTMGRSLLAVLKLRLQIQIPFGLVRAKIITKGLLLMVMGFINQWMVEKVSPTWV